MKSHARTGRASGWAIIGLAVAMLLTASPVATATDNNMGTIKVHDESSADPPPRNEPHVECEFWVEGFNMADSSGRIEIQSWPPTGDMEIVLTMDWTGTPEVDGKGHHFLVGPLTLDAGHYRVEAFAATGHPGDSGHFSKAKMFWVDGCDKTPPDTPLACPEDLAAVANGDGSVSLTFTPATGSDATLVYRAEADGEFEFLASVEGSSYLDTTTVAGTAYAYTVTALFGDRESVDCEVVEVSAIPEFPTIAATGLAAGLGLLAFTMARRKR